MKHIVSFSGGADSTAVAILLHERGVDFELLFADTGAELPETYWTITEVVKKLKRKLAVVGSVGFYAYLVQFGFLLPSMTVRWCTRQLKGQPIDAAIETDDICYIGIRADEQHRAKIKKPYEIQYPIIGAGLGKKDVLDLCRKHDLLNPIYEWRSNCSCFCCPFQRKADWRGLWENHPDLFKLAEQWEDRSVEIAAEKGSTPYRWNQNYTLKQLREATDAQFDMFKECSAEPCLICKFS